MAGGESRGESIGRSNGMMAEALIYSRHYFRRLIGVGAERFYKLPVCLRVAACVVPSKRH